MKGGGCCGHDDHMYPRYHEASKKKAQFGVAAFGSSGKGSTAKPKATDESEPRYGGSKKGKK